MSQSSPAAAKLLSWIGACRQICSHAHFSMVLQSVGMYKFMSVAVWQPYVETYQLLLYKV